MKKRVFPQKRRGNIQLPSSKSDSQRSILAAALCKGTSEISHIGNSSDELAMLQAVQELGAKITWLDNQQALIQGIESFPTSTQLKLHESGLGFRLMTSVCAAHPGKHRIDGSGSLTQRSMHFFEETLPDFGVRVQSNNGFIPLEMQGEMHGAEIELDGSLSSQYLSGLLMALPLLPSESRLYVRDLKSIPYVQMTLNTLAQFGISIQHHQFEQFVIAGNQHYIPTNYLIEGDWSAASYWLVASALGQDIRVEGLSLQSLQADKAILTAFKNANCDVLFSEHGISIDGTNRTSFQFDATHCPDLFPALVTFAALCEGRSDIQGLNRLKHKESDRGVALQSEFEKLGVQLVLDELTDTIHIYGKNQLDGGIVDAHNDHRMAMCLAIAGMFADSPIEIEDAESVAKSYPNFWNDLEALKLID